MSATQPIATAAPRRATPAIAARVRELASIPPDLVIFALLLVVTATFGRSFSKLSLGFSWLHPTEVALALTLVIAIVRLGPRAAFDRVRSTGVLIPLLVLWFFGALAAIRGLKDWGFSLVLHDIGLVEYSLIVPIVALVVGNRSQLLWLVRALALGGLLALVVQALALWTPLQWDIGVKLGLISVASGMYIAFLVAWVFARRASGMRTASWEYGLAIAGVMLIAIGVARAAWLGVFAALAITVLLAAPGRRLVTAGLVVAVVIVGTALSIPAKKVSFGSPPAAPTSSPAQGTDPSSGDASGGPSSANPSVFGEISASFNADIAGGQAANSSWRVAYWQFLIEETAHNPLGVGFGQASAFSWHGVNYDRRTGDPADPFDVTAPHNSFVNLLYRMGVFAALALLAIVAVAAWRLLQSTRSAVGEDRSVGIMLLGLIAITGAVAALSVALEGPFLGIYFWVAVGLGLIAPALLRSSRSEPNAPPERTLSAPASAGR